MKDTLLLYYSHPRYLPTTLPSTISSWYGMPLDVRDDPRCPGDDQLHGHGHARTTELRVQKAVSEAGGPEH